MKQPKDLVWLPLEDHMYWMNHQAQAVRIGEQVSDRTRDEPDDGFNAFSLDEPYQVIFDTGTSLVYIPATLYSDFITHVLDIVKVET